MIEQRQVAWPWLMAVAMSLSSAALRAEPEPAARAEAAPAATPDGFDARRRLGPEELESKEEGGYFTGLPLVNYDTNTGVGFGARAYYYFDGERTDLRFAYTPYLYRVFLQAFATTGGYQFHWLDLDARNVFSSAFTLRSALIVQINTDQHFYGISTHDLAVPGAEQYSRRFEDYQRALDQVDSSGQTLSRYDSYRLAQPTLLVSVERPLLRGLFRPMLGVGITYNDIEDYTGDRVDVGGALATQGPTRLSEQCATGTLTGCAGGWNNYLRLGLAFDTRDFEPDPNRGVFIDLGLDLGTRWLGSEYDWARAMVAPRVYVPLWPSATDLVLAGRATLVVQSRDTPFFAMNTIPYMDEPRPGLGGLRTLRGFKQDRFVGPVMMLLNAELRWTFARTPLFGQRFAWMVVPFVDIGGAYSSLFDPLLPGNGFERDQGAALRISWNLATIITVEYAVSDEDSGFYVNFGHIF